MTPEAAVAATLHWAVAGFKGEPSGWHRNPHDGRRRPDGDPGKEYIAR